MVINDQFRKQQLTVIWFEDLKPIKLQFVLIRRFNILTFILYFWLYQVWIEKSISINRTIQSFLILCDGLYQFDSKSERFVLYCDWQALCTHLREWLVIISHNNLWQLRYCSLNLLCCYWHIEPKNNNLLRDTAWCWEYSSSPALL